MIKLVETASFPDGTSKTTEKQFSSRYALEREFEKSDLPHKVLKELRLNDEAKIKMYLPLKEGDTEPKNTVDITIKIVDEPKPIILTDR
jgi:hypothetical protein